MQAVTVSGRQERMACAFAASILFMGSLLNALSLCLPGLSSQAFSYVQYALYACVFALLLFNLPLLFARFAPDMALVPLLLAFWYAASMLRSEETVRQVLRQSLLQKTFLFCLPAYFGLRLVRDYSLLLKTLYRLALPVTLLLTAAFFTRDVGAASEYLLFSDSLFLPSILYMHRAVKDRHAPSAALFGWCLAMVFLGGRRSTLLYLLVGFILCCAAYKRRGPLAVCALLGAGLLVFQAPLLQGLTVVSQRVGVGGRTLEKLLSGSALDDSRRFEQYLYGLELLFSSPSTALLGLGVAGERALYLARFAHMRLQGYPHNVFIEWLLHHGVLLGGAMCGLFAASPVWFFLRNRRPERVAPFLCFYVLALQLLLQSSYLQSVAFFAFAGLLVSFVEDTP